MRAVIAGDMGGRSYAIYECEDCHHVSARSFISRPDREPPGTTGRRAAADSA